MAAYINQLVLKVAELCNLNCSYCYLYKHEDKTYRGRPKVMSDDVFDQMLFRVKEYCSRRAPHQMTLILHGGEPTLLGPARIARLAERANRVLEQHLGGIAMQTNGTLIDEEWVPVIKKYGIQVGVSLDGPSHVHDEHRTDFAGRGSHALAVRTLRLLQDAGMSPSILCVINPRGSGVETYRHFRSLNIRRLDFLLPDITHDSKRRFFGLLTGTPIADYLISVFDEWFRDDDPTIKIRLFWGFISTILGGSSETDQFGNPLSSYLVIETDGSIQANDVFRICENGMTDSGLNVASHGFDALDEGLPLLHRLLTEGMPLSSTCVACPERELCGGGYLPHRHSKRNGFDNPSAWCEDIRKLLAHIRKQVNDAVAGRHM